MIAKKDYNWFKRLGFYRKQQPFYGDCFVSIEEVLVPSYWTDISSLEVSEHKPRFIYSIRNGRIYDSLENKSNILQNSEELADFVTGRFVLKADQLERNKSIWDQLDNPELWYRPRSGRQLRMQTGRGGMELFNRSLLEELANYDPTIGRHPTNEPYNPNGPQAIANQPGYLGYLGMLDNRPRTFISDEVYNYSNIRHNSNPILNEQDAETIRQILSLNE